MAGERVNAYALARPPGHHCLPDFPNGFCLLSNIAIAIEANDFDLAGEMADVLSYFMELANKLEVDLESAYREKEKQNAQRAWE